MWLKIKVDFASLCRSFRFLFPEMVEKLVPQHRERAGSFDSDTYELRHHWLTNPPSYNRNSSILFISIIDDDFFASVFKLSALLILWSLGWLCHVALPGKTARKKLIEANCNASVVNSIWRIQFGASFCDKFLYPSTANLLLTITFLLQANHDE